MGRNQKKWPKLFFPIFNPQISYKKLNTLIFHKNRIILKNSKIEKKNDKIILMKSPNKNFFYASNGSKIESTHIQNKVKSQVFSISGSQKINKDGMI